MEGRRCRRVGEGSKHQCSQSHVCGGVQGRHEPVERRRTSRPSASVSNGQAVETG